MNGGQTAAAGETVVVTGVSSFIGIHVALELLRQGYRVVGAVSGPPEKYDALRSSRLQLAQSAGIGLRRLELTGRADVESFVLQERPAFWIHHAGFAVNYAGLNYDMDQGHAVNVAPLEHVYRSLQQAGCRGVVVTGSMAEYDDGRGDVPCDEQDACWPATPYGLSKLAETLRARQLAHQIGLNTRVARVFIPYGPLDAPGKLLPSVVRALRQGQPVALSPCEQRRDFLHVGELARGYAALLRDLDGGSRFEVFNLCSGAGVAVRQVLLEVAAQLGADPALLRFGDIAMRPGEPLVCYGANGKAAGRLGWQPQPLAEGIRTYLAEEAEGT